MSATTLEEILRQIRSGGPAPVCLFYGEEEYLIEGATRAVIEASLDEASRSFNLDLVYGSDSRGSEVVAKAVSFPMMSLRRVVVVRELEKLSDRDQMLAYLQSPCDTTVLLLIASRPDFRTKFFKELNAKALLCEFKQLYDDKIPDWVVAAVREMGKRIDMEAAQLINSYVGNGLREIHSELEKLCTFVGEAKEITVEHVRQLVGLSREYNIFELEKAIGRDDLRGSIGILEHMLRNGESAIGIVVLLTRYFQKLLVMHDPEKRKLSDQALAGVLRLPLFLMRDFRSAAKNFQPPRLRRCFNELLKADEKLKLSGDERAVMTLALYSILAPAEPALLSR